MMKLKEERKEGIEGGRKEKVEERKDRREELKEESN